MSIFGPLISDFTNKCLLYFQESKQIGHLIILFYYEGTTAIVYRCARKPYARFQIFPG